MSKYDKKKIYRGIIAVAIFLMVAGLVLSFGALIAADFNFANLSVNQEDLIENHIDCSATYVDTIVISDLYEKNVSYDIQIIPSADDEIHITYYTFSEHSVLYQVDSENRIFYLFSEAVMPWRENIHISFGTYHAPLIVEVPASVKAIRCDVDAAEITCEGLALDGDLICNSDAATMALRDMDVKGTISLDGDAAEVSMEHIATGSLNVNCDFGSVQMEDIAVGDVMIESDTCDIELTSVFAQGNLDLSTDFGSIMMSSVSADTVSVKSDTCDVDFISLGCEKALVFDVSFGDISGTIDDSQNSFTVFTKVDFGDSNLAYGGNGPKTLEANVDTGNIDIQFLK